MSAHALSLRAQPGEDRRNDAQEGIGLGTRADSDGGENKTEHGALGRNRRNKQEIVMEKQASLTLKSKQGDWPANERTNAGRPRRGVDVD